MAGGGFSLPGLTDFVLIGRGGFSRVYRAHQDQFARDVAVKILDVGVIDERAQRRFIRECQATGRLASHPNIVSVHYADISNDGNPYIVMEFCSQGSFAAQLAERGPIDPGAALDIGRKMAEALAASHAIGILHRDVKPANILITDYGQPALADFGIALSTDSSRSVGTEALTVDYAPPEVLEGVEPDVRADLYSLGVTLYTLLVGLPPYGTREKAPVAQQLMRILRDPVPLIDRNDVSGDLRDLVRSLMDKDPANRPASAQEVAERFAELLGGDRSAAARPVPTWPVTAVADGPATLPAAASEDKTSVRPSEDPPTTAAPDVEDFQTVLRRHDAPADFEPVPSAGPIAGTSADLTRQRVSPAKPVESAAPSSARNEGTPDTRGRARKVWPYAATVASIAVIGGVAGLVGSNSGGGGGQPSRHVAAVPEAVVPALAKGGQLNVLMTADFEHLDPQRNYVGSALNFGRLIYRQLTAYKSEPGTAGSELEPDLATDLGTATDNAKTWTFTLKDGLKYENGTEIKASDIKYGVERSMSPIIPDGPQYAKQYLEGGTSYTGPFGGSELDSIIADDANKTITFKLAQPHGDFGYTVSLPTFSPVPRAMDKKVGYDNRPFSSGPYKISSYARGKSITLSRNPYWGQDTVRKALPEVIKATFGLDPDVIDQRLVASAGEDANAVTIDTSVQPANIARVLSDPQIRTRSLRGTTGFIRYAAINTQKGVTRNLKVRQAIEYAVNKTDQQTARGGPYAAGDLGSTILAPTVGGHKDFNAYDGGATGDVTKAKQLLSEAGFPSGIDLTLAGSNSPKAVAQETALQASLARAGIRAKIQSIDSAVYYTTIGDTAKEPEIVFAGWGPDWPSAGTVIPPLLDGRQIVPQGNQNFAQLNVSEVNSEIDRIQAITDQSKAATEWGNLDEKIMTDYAPIVPLLNEKAIYLVGSSVKGAFVHAFYGEPDVAALGVA